MARGSNELIEWGGILLVVFFFVPKLLQAFAGSNIRTAVQYDPGTALKAQEARAVTTAGLAGNTFLANLLSGLLRTGQSGGGKSAGGSQGGGVAQQAPRPQSVQQANNANVDTSQLLNPDGTVNIREPDFADLLNQSGPYAGGGDVPAPDITLGGDPAAGFDWAGLFGTPAAPVFAGNDASGFDPTADFNSFSVLGEDAATMPAPDLANVDSSFDFFTGGLSDFGLADPTPIDLGGDWGIIGGGGGGGADSFDNFDGFGGATADLALQDF